MEVRRAMFLRAREDEVKWELGFVYFSTGKMGFGDWDWEKSSV